MGMLRGRMAICRSKVGRIRRMIFEGTEGRRLRSCECT